MLSLNIYVNKRVFFAGNRNSLFSDMLNKEKIMSPENEILGESFL